MNADIEDVELDGGGLFYVRSCLSQGRTLSHFLQVTVDAGRTHSLLPQGFAVTSTINFEAGGILKRGEMSRLDSGISVELIERKDVDTALVAFIAQFLDSSGDRLAIFEHPYAKPDDPWLKKISGQFARHQDEVYLLVLSSDASPNAIERVLAAWGGTKAVAALTNDHERHATPGVQLDVERLRILATNTEHVITRAFDGESVVIWSR